MKLVPGALAARELSIFLSPSLAELIAASLDEFDGF